MKDLITKLEAATEGSRELDREIAVHPETPSCGVVKNADLEQVRSAEEDWVPPMVSVPHYTTSIDAALTLVPEGWFVKAMGDGVKGRWFCVLVTPDGFKEVKGHSTPALALCIAALKARSA